MSDRPNPDRRVQVLIMLRRLLARVQLAGERIPTFALNPIAVQAADEIVQESISGIAIIDMLIADLERNTAGDPEPAIDRDLISKCLQEIASSALEIMYLTDNQAIELNSAQIHSAALAAGVAFRRAADGEPADHAAARCQVARQTPGVR